MMQANITQSSRPRRRHSGQALVPVIFVTSILILLAIALTTNATRDLRAASNYYDNAVRFNAAQGAMNYAATALTQTSNYAATYGNIPSNSDTDANGWMQIGDAWVKFEIMDTSGCININTATTAMLNRIPVFTNNPDLVPAIMDWRTPGDQPSANGAKSEYYNALNPPYDCKSAPFDTVEELLLVKEMTPTILYGNAGGNPIYYDTTTGSSGTASNGATRQAAAGAPGSTASPGGSTTPGGGNNTPRPGGTPGSTSGGAQGAGAGDTDWTDIYNSSTLPLAEYLTTLSLERNIAADGSDRVNINTASAQDLQNKLGLSATLANRLVGQRPGNAQPSNPFGGGPNGNPGNRPPGGPFPGGGPNGNPGNRPPGGPFPGGGPRPGGNRPGGNGNGGQRPGGGFRPGGIRSVPITTRQAAARPGGGGPGGVPGSSATPGGNSNPGGMSGNPGGTNGNPRPGGATPGGASAGGQGFTDIGQLLQLIGFSKTVMQGIVDHITVDDNAYHENLININTAPAEVLATVPGMTHDALNAIINYRQGGQAFQSLGDLFTLDAITQQTMQSILPHLCTKSSAYRVRIKVRTRGQQSLYAVSALVELTDAGPTILQWREYPRVPGWSAWQTPPSLPTPAPPTASGSPTTSRTTAN